jgi:hypothetical protein
MNAEEIRVWVEAIAVVAAAVYTAVDFHQKRRSQMSQPIIQTGLKKARERLSAIAAVVLIWTAIGLSWADRHYWGPDRKKEHAALSAENARLDAISWTPGLRMGAPAEDHHIYINVGITNNGRSAARGMAHSGNAIVSTVPIPEKKLRVFFIFEKQEIEEGSSNESFEIQPGNNQAWFTIPNAIGASIVTLEDLDSDKLVYVTNMMRYRDTLVSGERYIYTESCIYFKQHVMHYCEAGHNGSYIAYPIEKDE